MDELKEQIDWLRGFLEEKFPEYIDYSVQPTLSIVTKMLNRWKSEAGEIPKATCSEIDHVIKKINDALGTLSNARKFSNCSCEDCETEDVKDLADDAYRDLNSLEDEMETLRNENQQLRQLGEFWYEKCKELLNKA